MRIDMVFDVIPGSNRIVPNFDKDHDDFQTQHSKSHVDNNKNNLIIMTFHIRMEYSKCYVPLDASKSLPDFASPLLKRWTKIVKANNIN